ncbi:MAG: hypothetical protein HY011_24415 [Acidobacteria bacterium]|nr:hypothetical protein [Acidobacteriota bacterium]
MNEEVRIERLIGFIELIEEANQMQVGIGAKHRAYRVPKNTPAGCRVSGLLNELRNTSHVINNILLNHLLLTLNQEPFGEQFIRGALGQLRQRVRICGKEKVALQGIAQIVLPHSRRQQMAKQIALGHTANTNQRTGITRTHTPDDLFDQRLAVS